MKVLYLSILAALFFTTLGRTEDVTPPNSDTSFGTVLLSCSQGESSASFTAYVTGEIGTSGSALLVSLFRPYFDGPILNRVHYKVGTNQSIQLDQNDFALVIDPAGAGTYQRKGRLETPPDLLDSGETPERPFDSTIGKADYSIYGPITLKCVTIFSKVHPPTGFSAGNR